MTARSNLCLLLKPAVFSAIFICGLCSPLALSEEPPSIPGVGEVPLHIEVQDGQGARIAGSDIRASSTAASAVLSFDHEYQPGDRVIVGGARRISLRLDESVPECLLYIPDSSQGNYFFEIPYGRAENQTGSAYAPESFAGKSHRVTVRAQNKRELSGYRNLALNPCDQRRPEGPGQIYPHASSNSVSRSLFDFEARNAIDGVTQNGHHGVWPYQSWGPQLRTDIWWKVDFGRSVDLDKIRLMVRADFPHDSYWKSAEVEFSDGSHLTIQIGSSPGFQEFPFPKRRVSWLRIANPVSADPSKWCSFIEVETWGRDPPSQP